jgi:hypothetical protein
MNRFRPSGGQLSRRGLFDQGPLPVLVHNQIRNEKPVQRTDRRIAALAHRRHKIPNARARRDLHRLEKLLIRLGAIRQTVISADGSPTVSGCGMVWGIGFIDMYNRIFLCRQGVPPRPSTSRGPTTGALLTVLMGDSHVLRYRCCVYFKSICRR